MLSLLISLIVSRIGIAIKPRHRAVVGPSPAICDWRCIQTWGFRSRNAKDQRRVQIVVRGQIKKLATVFSSTGGARGSCFPADWPALNEAAMSATAKNQAGGPHLIDRMRPLGMAEWYTHPVPWQDGEADSFAGASE